MLFEGWQTVYDNSPRKIYRNFDDHKEELLENILGGEVCMWSEVAGGQSLDGKIWPRAAALGERLWAEPEEGETLKINLALVPQKSPNVKMT